MPRSPRRASRRSASRRTGRTARSRRRSTLLGSDAPPRRPPGRAAGQALWPSSRTLQAIAVADPALGRRRATIDRADVDAHLGQLALRKVAVVLDTLATAEQRGNRERADLAARIVRSERPFATLRVAHDDPRSRQIDRDV